MWQLNKKGDADYFHLHNLKVIRIFGFRTRTNNYRILALISLFQLATFFVELLQKVSVGLHQMVFVGLHQMVSVGLRQMV